MKEKMPYSRLIISHLSDFTTDKLGVKQQRALAAFLQSTRTEFFDGMMKGTKPVMVRRQLKVCRLGTTLSPFDLIDDEIQNLVNDEWGRDWEIMYFGGMIPQRQLDKEGKLITGDDGEPILAVPEAVPLTKDFERYLADPDQGLGQLPKMNGWPEWQYS